MVHFFIFVHYLLPLIKSSETIKKIFNTLFLQKQAVSLKNTRALILLVVLIKILNGTRLQGATMERNLIFRQANF
ncbi:hypothetical protein PN36_07015 [Candidatus Thiomargarita nelsonii]|uniref:Uncharacterized protein n=1 Tax=Candidatus Thiomargarita nelsonii TaxID=1003181 RepID=A0A0A6P4A4_9GAMM|nr:hypothetical protein PN36_07015 [Candidatus Thiomargarita nelsonii]